MNGVTFGKSISLGDVDVDERASVRAFDLLWGTIAATLIPVSLIWDFSWESTIGVDRFWSPPHLTTHIGVWLCGLLALRLILIFTLAGRRSGDARGVRVACLHGPSGAWMLLWGALVMQAALPLDNWWQQAYGLGAGLWHPPQILKAASFMTILVGGIALCAAAQSGRATQTRIARAGSSSSPHDEGVGRGPRRGVFRRERASSPRPSPPSDGGEGVSLIAALPLCAAAQSGGATQTRIARALLIWQAGLLLTMCAVILTATNYPNWQHGAWFYKISCAVYPGVLLLARRASARKWSATQAALIYMVVAGAMVWLLPLYPARPLTVPIHNPTDHLMPPAFPLLLVLPAVVMDWLRGRRVFLPGRKAATDRPTPTPSEEGSGARWTVPLLGGVRGGFKSTNRELWIAVTAGICFVAAFVPAQWFFSKFLLSASSDNWFFAGGGRHWPFFLKIDQARIMFWGVKQDPLTWRAALMAMVFAMVSAWIGLRVGAWLNKLRR